MKVARDERMKANPRAQPSRTSLSRDGVARTIHANTARGARSLAPHWHGVQQVDAMRADGNRRTSSGWSVTTTVTTDSESLCSQRFPLPCTAEGGSS